MPALSDNQLAAVMTAAGKLPTEKRGVSLERVVARLNLSPGFTATEFADTLHSPLRWLIQEKSAPNPGTPLPAAVVCRFLAVGEGDVCARLTLPKSYG
jgi:hypothetical protein